MKKHTLLLIILMACGQRQNADHAEKVPSPDGSIQRLNIVPLACSQLLYHVTACQKDPRSISGQCNVQVIVHCHDQEGELLNNTYCQEEKPTRQTVIYEEWIRCPVIPEADGHIQDPRHEWLQSCDLSGARTAIDAFTEREGCTKRPPL